MKIFDTRAEAEVVGHIIILGITILGVSMIALYGVPAINSLQDMTNIKNTEQAFTVLDYRASRAALGESPRQITNINLGGGTISVVPNSSEPSFILVELKNDTSVLYNISIPMGKIVYTMGDRAVGYEGGGVWSKYSSGSVMLSPPEFHYNGITLTLPAINISGNSSVGGKGTFSLNVEKNGDAQRIYPTANTYVNPIPTNVTAVNITIKSEYYDAWASYFKSIPLTNVSSNAGNKMVTVTLLTPPVATNFTYGALASDDIEVDNNAIIDSYNSSLGNYTYNFNIGNTGNGSIRANNEISLGIRALVNGSALSGGTIDGSGGPSGANITKDAYSTPLTSVNARNKYPAVARLSLPSTTSLVSGKINDAKAKNDNLNLTSGGCLTGAGNTTLNGNGWSQCTISPGLNGSYYLTTFSLPNKVLIFNTSSGPINIAIDSSDFTVNNNANITVNGSNPVKLYLNRNIIINNNAKINPTTNDTSNLFQVFTSSSQPINLNNNAYFCGFILAPGAEITIDQNMKVYGALVGEAFTLKQNQVMHFDEALQNLNVGLGSGTTIMYLHITRNDIRVRIS